MPERYGSWKSVYSRFRRWIDDGTLDKVLARLRARIDRDGVIDWDTWCVDGSNITASKAAAGAGQRGALPSSRTTPPDASEADSFQDSSSCCGIGAPIGVTVSAGQPHESKHFEDAIASVWPKNRRPMWIAGDKEYSYPRVRARCERRGIFDVIPQRSDQVERDGRRGLNRLAYRGRNVVERTIGHLKKDRRIGTRFEKLATSFLGMLKLDFLRRYLAIPDPSDTA